MLIIWLPSLSTVVSQFLKPNVISLLSGPRSFSWHFCAKWILGENLCYKCMLHITMKHLVEQFSIHFAFWDNLQISKPSFK